MSAKRLINETVLAYQPRNRRLSTPPAQAV